MPVRLSIPQDTLVEGGWQFGTAHGTVALLFRSTVLPKHSRMPAQPPKLPSIWKGDGLSDTFDRVDFLAAAPYGSRSPQGLAIGRAC